MTVWLLEGHLIPRLKELLQTGLSLFGRAGVDCLRTFFELQLAQYPQYSQLERPITQFSNLIVSQGVSRRRLGESDSTISKGFRQILKVVSHSNEDMPRRFVLSNLP